MKKMLLLLFLCKTGTCFSQKDSTKNKLIYASFFAMLKVPGSKFGGGMYLGFTPIRAAGFGAGFEATPIEKLNDGYKMGFNTFGELRLFIPSKTIFPSLAFQYGIFNYSDNRTSSYDANDGRHVFEIFIKGKQSIGGNVTLCFNKKNTGTGFSIGYSYRSVTMQGTTNTISPGNKNTQVETFNRNYSLITAGFSF